MAYKQYIAGLFDGEGSAGVYTFTRTRRGKKVKIVYPVCQVRMTDREPIDFLHYHFPAYGIHKAKLPSGKTVYGWHLNFHKALNFAKAIRPYVKNKSKQRQLAKVIKHYVGV